MEVVSLPESGYRARHTAKEARLHGPDEPTGSPDVDLQLLEGCRAGDPSAFERLYELHGARMKSIAANLVGNLADAEDAVQDCFLKVYRGATAFRGNARFSTWIYRVLVNSCYDLLRKRRRRGESPQSERESESREATAGPPSDHALRLALETCVGQLDARRRAAFVLCGVEGFTHREAGEILGVSEGASKTLLFEARRELQQMLWASGMRTGATA